MRHEQWQRALDAQIDTHKWSLSEFGIAMNKTVFESMLMGDETFDRFPLDDSVSYTAEYLARTIVPQTLHRGDTIYVTSDMLHLIMSAANDLPEDVCFDQHTMISKTGFVMFEETIVGGDRWGDPMAVDGLMWIVAPVRQKLSQPSELTGEVGIIIFFLVNPDNMSDHVNQAVTPIMREKGVAVPPFVISHFYPAIDGLKVPNQDTTPGHELVTRICKLFVAMHLIAHQKIGQPIQLRPDRALRKRVQRYFDPNERLITVITLRRKSVKKDNEEPGKVEWSRRWAVQGHWRHQYYPKSKTHDWVYIYEYIKGPEDKPFRPPDHRIFNFVR